MKNIKYSIAPFTQAWDMLIDVELPESLVSNEDVETDTMLLNFPAVGAFIGLACYITAWIFNIVPGKPIAPYLAAIVITLGLEFITSGRYLSSLISFIENRGAKRSTPESLVLLNDEFNAARSSTGTLLLVSLFLIRVLCFSFLIQNGCIFWLIIVLTLNYGAQAYLAASDDFQSGKTFFDTTPDFVRNLGIVTAAITFIAGLAYFPAVAVALLVVGFYVFKFKNYCEGVLGGMTAKIIGVGGYIAEFIALLLGLTLLV